MGPFLKSDNKTNKIMVNLIISLIPIILFNVYKNGYIPYSYGKTDVLGLIYPLIFVIVGSITSFICELIYTIIKKKDIKSTIKNSYSFFPGLFLSLILPINTPIYILILGSLFATIFGKLVFGGFGKNIFNPALVGYMFIMIVFGSVFTSDIYLNSYEIDTITSATPLTNAKLVDGIGNYNNLIKPFGDLKDFFVGLIPGSIGEVSSFLCLLALLYLSLTKTIKWKIPVCYIATVFVTTCIIGRILGQGLYYPTFHLLSGGLLFGAVFMATDPVTSPVTSVGQILYGIFLGILTVFLRFAGVEGVATSILIMNLFVTIIDRIGSRSRFDLSKSLIPFIIVWVLIIFNGLYLANQNKDENFNILSKEINGNTTTYVATQKGYGGDIKAKVVIENDKVLSYEILSHSETKNRYDLIVSNNYINNLINNQDNLNEVDTISSATVTSEALKKLLDNIMND